MATVSPCWTSFNSGELSPRLDGRMDMPQYMKGGRICLNFIPTVQGPLVRRGGSRYIGAASGIVNQSLLLPFSRSRTESYLLEFGFRTLRFYFNGLPVLDPSTMAPYQLLTPYTQADLFNEDGTSAISYAESVDELYLMHPKYPTQILSFFGPTLWTLLPADFTDGPWQDGNKDQTATMHIAGGVTVGSFITVLCDRPVFEQGHVGSLLRIHQQDLTAIKPWQPGQKTPQIGVGVARRSGFNTYQCVSAAPGVAPPGGTTLTFVQTGGSTLTHTQGNAWDGDQTTTIDPIGSATYYSTGVQWSYQDCGYGVVKLGSIAADGLSAQGTVQRQFPASLVGPSFKSYLWELGQFNAFNGFPSHGTFYKQRLLLAGLTPRFWGSVVGDFNNFADLQFGEIVADSAITAQILNGQFGKVAWIAPQKVLIIGTENAEFVIGQQSTADAFGPTNFSDEPQSNFGGRSCGAIRVQTSTIFVQQNGLSLREFNYVFANDAFQSIDLNVESDHITASGIVGMAWAKNPNYIIWCILANGNVVGMTYNPEQSVRCWHRHDLAGGKAVSITAIPSGDGTVDDVYLCVRRSNTDQFGNTNTFYTIEKLEQPIRTSNGDLQRNSFYVDCGLSLDNTIDATLNVSGPFGTVGASCAFIASLGVFNPATDIGRYIRYDYTTYTTGEDGLPQAQNTTAIAQITSVDSGNHTAHATIVTPFPNLFGVSIPANGWRMTVTKILAASIPLAWQGNTISVLGDGADFGDFQIPVGAQSDLVLPAPAATIQAGIRSPACWKSMRPETREMDQTGVPIGKPRRIAKATVRVLDELGVKMGRSLDTLDPIAIQGFDTPNNEAPPLRQGNTERLSFNGEYDDDGRITIYADRPLPATICAIGTLMETQEDA